MANHPFNSIVAPSDGVEKGLWAAAPRSDLEYGPNHVASTDGGIRNENDAVVARACAARRRRARRTNEFVWRMLRSGRMRQRRCYFVDRMDRMAGLSDVVRMGLLVPIVDSAHRAGGDRMAISSTQQGCERTRAGAVGSVVSCRVDDAMAETGE